MADHFVPIEEWRACLARCAGKLMSAESRLLASQAECERLREALSDVRGFIECERDKLTHPGGRRAFHVDGDDQVRVDLLTEILNSIDHAFAPSEIEL